MLRTKRLKRRYDFVNTMQDGQEFYKLLLTLLETKLSASNAPVCPPFRLLVKKVSLALSAVWKDIGSLCKRVHGERVPRWNAHPGADACFQSSIVPVLHRSRCKDMRLG